MKNILVLAKSLGGGGAEVALIEFLNHLDMERCNVTLLLLDKDEEYKYRLNKNVNIKYLEFDKPIYKKMVSMYSVIGKVIKKVRLNAYFDIYHYVLTHTNLCISNNYDLALDFYGYGSFTTEVLAKAIKSKKKATWLHDGKMPWLKNTANDLISIDYVFCVSETVKKVFVKQYPQLKNKAKVFYNFIDIDRIKRNSLKPLDVYFNRKEINIVTVGRLTEQKGIDIAIKAAKVLKERNILFKWFVIGDGKLKNKLTRMIKKNNLVGKFILLGRKDNPYNYMRNCDLYIQPSRHEGMCTTINEALVLNKVIIASDIPENGEQIKNYKNGLLVKLDGEELANKIIEVSNNESLKHKIKENIKKYNFNSNEQLNMFNDVIKI